MLRSSPTSLVPDDQLAQLLHRSFAAARDTRKACLLDHVVPVAVSAFPDEIYQLPRSWAERAYPRLVHYNKVDKGGHFAAWEQPQLFVEGLRSGFRTLRA